MFVKPRLCLAWSNLVIVAMAAYMPDKTGVLQAEMAAPLTMRAAPFATPAPAFDDAGAILKRQDAGSETCGYRTDAQLRPFVCGAGQTCTNSNTIRGCCTDCLHSTFATDCLDRTHSLCTNTAASHPLRYCCTDFEEVPYCATYLWSTSTDTASVYTMFICESTSQRSLQTLAAEGASSTSPRTSGSVSATTTTVSTATASPASPSDQPAPASAGPIAGGVVGGVALIAALVLAFFFLRRRARASDERRRRVEQSSAEPLDPPMQQPPELATHPRNEPVELYAPPETWKQKPHWSPASELAAVGQDWSRKPASELAAVGQDWSRKPASELAAMQQDRSRKPASELDVTQSPRPMWAPNAEPHVEQKARFP